MPFKTFEPVSKEILHMISVEQAWHYQIIPVQATADFLEFHVSELSPFQNIQQELEMVFNKQVKLTSRPAAEIEDALTRLYRKDHGAKTAKDSVQFSISDKDFVAAVIREASEVRSSDIHIEVYDDKSRIRFRIDGKLVERIRLPKSDYPALINKVKIMAGLDISERRLPQDGRIFFNRDGLRFDIRVSVLPTLYGEKVVLRLLGNRTQVDLDGLGFSEIELVNYKESIRKPNGIVLISGPTGSGKTTTLYATLKFLNKDTDNILTIEDPIEYTLDGINQVQVKEEIGLSFSTALRTFLRQDPDVIMVGEIRDTETANLAIRAALTGHLVLSTIHTNSAWGTISRLIEMGIPAFLLANTLNATLAQRLIRLLCPHCKLKRPVSPNLFPKGFNRQHEITEHFIHQGCKVCFFTGYKGRRAIYEVIPVDSHVEELILTNAKDVSEYFRSLKIRTLQECAFDVLKAGETSIEEIYPLLLNEQF